VRVGTKLEFAGSLILALSPTVVGCDKLRRNDAAQAGRARAELKRQQIACGSPVAGDRLKNLMFDDAIAEQQSNRANLDLLADYSVARLEDPVVKGWDSSLDITRCKGHFILEVPPGAERAFDGQRRLEADIEYTAQASADGAGLVYQQKGAAPIVAKLATFNIASGAYRPPPAIDGAQATAGTPAQPTVTTEPPAREPTQARQADGSSTPETAPAPVAPKSAQSTRPKRVDDERIAKQTSIEPTVTAPLGSGSPNGEATVRAFYGALAAGNGAAASSQVIPEKRSGGAYSPAAISRFYGRLPEPIRLTSVVPLAARAYRVRYHYSAGRSQCNGSAIVTLTSRGGRNLIQSIQALNGC
jgi:hypothetical protein